MTTIAYKDGVLATDTQVTVGGSYSYHVDKLLFIKERKAWVAMCGDVSLFRPFLEWFRADDDDMEVPKATKEQDFAALVLYENGEVVIYEADMEYIDHDPTKPMALGSGAQGALVAMYAGKSAEEAVALTSMVDLSTGPVVHASKKSRPKKQPQKRGRKIKS